MSHDASRFYGLDTSYAQDSSRRMEDSAQELGSMVNSVSAMLDSVVWIGPAAQRFKQDWDASLRPELQAATESLSSSAAELNYRADLQNQVSQ